MDFDSVTPSTSWTEFLKFPYSLRRTSRAADPPAPQSPDTDCLDWGFYRTRFLACSFTVVPGFHKDSMALVVTTLAGSGCCVHQCCMSFFTRPQGSYGFLKALKVLEFYNNNSRSWDCLRNNIFSKKHLKSLNSINKWSTLADAPVISLFSMYYFIVTQLQLCFATIKSFCTHINPCPAELFQFCFLSFEAGIANAISSF